VELLLRARHLQVLGALQLNAHHVAGSGADVRVAVKRLDDNVAELAPRRADVDVGRVDLPVLEVYVPDAQHAVTARDELVRGVVEEREAE
jgi:hypothetical protein